MSQPPSLVKAIRYWLSDIDKFSRLVLEIPLRPYQLEPARTVLQSVFDGSGHTYVVMMSRQAGKNELSGQLEAYLLNLYQRHGGQIVKASPTFKPQTLNSIIRLYDRLHNTWNAGHCRRREGYMIELKRARALFFSAEPSAKVVGATADLLLEGDEAQDITEAKWYKDFSPMAASTNATTVLYGTAWTSNTLLARTIQDLQQLQAKDGHRRVFTYDADQVALHVPAYGRYVARQVSRLGRDHPLIKTQYYLETIDAAGGLFTPARVAMMHGTHHRTHTPVPDHRYALLLDVAGEEETEGDPVQRATMENPRRDATALTIVEVEPHFGQLPRYRCVDRHLWLGVKHTTLHARILALADHWHAAWIIVDATGIGAGLASFLTAARPLTTIPVIFSPKTKSDMGWNFVAAVETGRYTDYANDQALDTRQFWYEVEHCQYEILPGPGERIKWGVWESPAYTAAIAHGHDDLLISAALCTIIDDLDWTGTGSAEFVQRADPLQELDEGDW